MMSHFKVIFWPGAMTLNKSAFVLIDESKYYVKPLKIIKAY